MLPFILVGLGSYLIGSADDSKVFAKGGSIKYPENGTPEWHQLQIAKKTINMTDAMAGVMGGMNREEAKKILDKYKIKYSEGGAIKNQYHGKTATQVWNEWTPEQRRHFLSDHRDAVGTDYNLHIIEESASKLPSFVLKEIERHITRGQYAEGGTIDVDNPSWYQYDKPELKERTKKRLQEMADLGMEEVGVGQFGVKGIVSGLYIEMVWSLNDKGFNDYLKWVKEAVEEYNANLKPEIIQVGDFFIVKNIDGNGGSFATMYGGGLPYYVTNREDVVLYKADSVDDAKSWIKERQ